MKPGVVTNIRINPRDAQSVVDYALLLGINPYDGRSFATLAATTLASLLEQQRLQGKLPDPDPYKYNERVRPILSNKDRKRKQYMQQETMEPVVQGLKTAPIPPTSIPVVPQRSLNELEYVQGIERFSQLNDKLNGGQSLTAEEAAEYRRLNEQLF